VLVVDGRAFSYARSTVPQRTRVVLHSAAAARATTALSTPMGSGFTISEKKKFRSHAKKTGRNFEIPDQNQINLIFFKTKMI
jgi:hypothetical protein